jgi:phenylacetate-CoA ligase
MGTLVATSLHNYAMPLIRYVTNDESAFKVDACACGRALPLMEDVTTKAEDLLTLKDGRLISPSVLTHPFKPLVSIDESQIVQESPELVRVLLVPGGGFTDEDSGSLVKGLEERLGEGVKVVVEVVDELERTSSGKFKWVISKVGLGI